MRFKKITAVASAIALLGSLFTAIPVSAELPEDDFVVAAASEDYAAPIYIDPDGSEYDGLSLIAAAFAGDVELVSGQTPDVATNTTSLTGKMPVIAGVIGENENGLLKEIITKKNIDVTDLKDKWETYKIQLVDNPTSDISKALVIIGSDKRGAIYGIFHISELMGVSPWVYWGDVLPEKKDVIGFDADELECTSKEPSVKYRGIFLNDENPCLTGWAKNMFGNYNHNFYATVYELILRLKGNYLWPAMWSNSFSEDGILGLSAEAAAGFDSLENARLADKYGVVMGTSHHEPMARAGVEWGRTYKEYMSQYYPDINASQGSSAYWDYFRYADAIDAFWEDGFTRNMNFDNIITLGMRGESDSPLGGSLSDNVTNLESVISSQKRIMEKYNKSDVPTVFCLYKEVEEYWYGGTDEVTGASVAGVRDSGLVDDTVVMLCDDNFGNLRSMPLEDERDRKGGWGLYYHFDYHGSPRDYRWVSSTPLEKIWENMTTAYEYKVDDIWIVNVGDIKPYELETSYFIDLAYDYDTWSEVNKIEEYTRQWSKQQFGYDGISEDVINDIAQIQSDYIKLNGMKKPEILFNSTYSIAEANEVYDIIDFADNIYNKVYEIYDEIPEALKDAYYQLVLYPAAGTANVNLMNMYSALNQMYYSEGSILANTYAELVNECIERDTRMQDYYNNTMTGGKWKEMMSTSIAHIGCTTWNFSEWSYPAASYVVPAGESGMIVNVDGSTTGITSGEATLPVFTSTGKEAYAITVSNSGGTAFDFTAKANADWIKLSKANGRVLSGDTIAVTVDWTKVKGDSEGTITITGANSEVTVKVSAKVPDTAGLEEKTFIAKDGIISIEAEHYIKTNGDWITIDNYGMGTSSIKPVPYTRNYKISDNVYSEYKINIDTAGEYTLTAYTTPANPRTNNGDLSYAISIDGGTAVEASTLPDGFIAGTGSSTWARGVLLNIHTSQTTHNVSAGVHTVRFYPLSSGVVLQKIVISEAADLGEAYCGPDETYYVGADDSQKELVHHAAADAAVIPGTIVADGETIVAADGTYEVTAEGAQDAVTVKLDGAEIAVIEPGETVSAELKKGTYTLSYEGEAPNGVKFSKTKILAPGVLLDHPMATADDVNADSRGYINRVDGNDDKRSVAYSDGAMQYTTTGMYTSSGFKYDITGFVKKAIEEVGPDVELTLTMDIKGAMGNNGTPAMGFMYGGTPAKNTNLSINNSSFTTVACTANLKADDTVYMYVYTGSPSVSVKNIKLTYPVSNYGVVLKHPMSTEDEVNAVADGYINRVDGNDDKRVVEFDNGAMKYTTTGLYTSSGFRYDVTDLIRKVIAERGTDTEFTLSMDIKGGVGSNGTPAMGFMQIGGSTPNTPLSGVINNSSFTTVTCKSVLSGDKQIYMYVYTGEPTVYVKNIMISFGEEEEEPDPTPGVIINHPMSTETEVAAVADGYVNLKSDVSVRSVEYNASNKSMSYTNANTYSSQGFKYDITQLVKQAIEKYGADTEFTLSMDIRGTVGPNYTPSMGFVKGENTNEARGGTNVIASTKLADSNVNNGSFTTVTCTSKLTTDDIISFYLYLGSPTVYVKNISVTYPVGDEPPAEDDVELVLPNFFAEGMVLQKGNSAIYGKGTPEAEYTVILSDGTTEYSAAAKAGEDGIFYASIIDAPASNDAYTLTVKSGNVSESIANVYVGDVYLLSGQSNMELNYSNAGYYYRTWNGGVEYADELLNELSKLVSTDKRIKYTRPTSQGSNTAGFDVTFENEAWTDCEKNNKALSIIGMLTAEQMLKDNAADYPIGLISTAVGGSAISTWQNNGTNFNARIAPFSNYGISGILWYQGEQDSRYENSTKAYEDNFVNLIDSWRDIFGYDTPFVYMSLADYKNDDETAMYAFEDIRNAQRNALDKVNNKHNLKLIMTMDTPTTPVNQIHPNGKDKVAQRAAKALEAMNYGFAYTEADYTGPLTERAELIGGKVVITFKNSSISGLTLKGEGSFELAGADGVYKPAAAALAAEDKIILTSEAADAVKVRYAYGYQPELTVFNGNDIPASPFEINVVPKTAGAVEIVGMYNDEKNIGVTITGGYEGSVLAGLYDENGVLLDIQIKTAEEGSLQAQTVTFEKSENANGGTIKIFNWNMDTLEPYSNVQERKVAEITNGTPAETDSFLYGELSAETDVTGEMSYEHGMPYRYYLPENYDSSKKYPLVMYLHGAGRTGDDNEAQLQNAKYLFEELLSDEYREKYPCIMVAPQCPKDEKWVDRNWGDGSYSLKDTPASDEITMARDIIYELKDKFSIDADRVYLAGQSMGGFGAWNLALHNPDIFAALIPLCGGASPEDAARLAETNMSIQVFHGDEDTTVPPSSSREMVSAVKAAGSNNIRYTEYEGEGHEVQTRAFKEYGVIDRMFESKISSNRSANDSNVVDLAIFMGQSNMAGRGEAADSIVCGSGHGYEFRAISDPTKLYDISEPFGLNENKDQAINDGTKRTGSMVSALVESYYNSSHTPIVAVSAAEGGTRAELWQPGTNRYKDAVERYNAAKKYLKENGYYIRSEFMVWCQGESNGDNDTSAEAYKTLTMNIINGMMNDTGVKHCFMVGIGHRRENSNLTDSKYDYLIQAQEELCANENDVDLVASFKFWRSAMKDAYHYHQEAYNAVGTRAGVNISNWIKNSL